MHTEETAPPEPAARPTRLWPRLLLAAVLVGAVVAFYALGLHRYLSWEAIRANVKAWKDQTDEHLPLALLLFFVVYVAVTALSLPVAAWLTLLAGALFGRWLGTAVVSAASTLGATLAFLSSRYLLRDWMQRRFGRRLGPINRGVERDGAYYLFTLRLVPAVPFFLINLGMGLTPMRVGTFALVSWAGMLLGTFLYVNAGTALASLDSPSSILDVKVVASLVALGLVPLLLRLLMRRRTRPATPGGEKRT
jgi:uncharacterized membrane protein YdjX (TVP38/TMEM64 family)